MARFHKRDERSNHVKVRQILLFPNGFNVQEGNMIAGLTKTRMVNAESADKARAACEAFMAKLLKSGWTRIVVESPPTQVGDKRRYTFNDMFFELELVTPTKFETRTGVIGKASTGGNVFNGADPVHTIWWAEAVIAERLSKGYTPA
jgi:hypothetical protein